MSIPLFADILKQIPSRMARGASPLFCLNLLEEQCYIKEGA